MNSNEILAIAHNTNASLTNTYTSFTLSRNGNEDTMIPKKRPFIITKLDSDNPQKKIKGPWTYKEHKKFLQLLKKYGNSWKKIQTNLKTRTCEQIRSHCQKHFESVKEKAIRDTIKSKIKSKFAVYYAYRNVTWVKCKNPLELFIKDLETENHNSAILNKKQEWLLKDNKIMKEESIDDMVNYRKNLFGNSFDNEIAIANGYLPLPNLEFDRELTPLSSDDSFEYNRYIKIKYDI